MNNQKNFTKRINSIPTMQIQNCEIKFVHNRRWKIKKKKQRNTAIPPISSCFFLFSHLNDFHQHTESFRSSIQFHWPRTANLLSPSSLDEKLRLQKPWSGVKIQSPPVSSQPQTTCWHLTRSARRCSLLTRAYSHKNKMAGAVDREETKNISLLAKSSKS